ncbi:unnamed protein product, partial [Meganyctiphanes norvegica]
NILDITNGPIIEDTTEPDITSTTINNDLSSEETTETTDGQESNETTDSQESKETTDSQESKETTDSQESKETTDKQESLETTDPSIISGTGDSLESFETTIINNIQSTTELDYTTEVSIDPSYQTTKPSVETPTTVFVAKPWEAHKCQEVYTLKPPLTPVHASQYCQGQLIGDRTRCNVFYYCSDLRTPYICTAGRSFDQNTQSCQVIANSMCQNKTLVSPSHYNCGQVKGVQKSRNLIHTMKPGPLRYSIQAEVDY